MQHMTEEQLVEHYYHEGDGEMAISHLASCSECAAEYETLRCVLALVTDAPVPERGPAYGEVVWNRLRWQLGASKRRRWQMPAAVAALLALAFFAGHFWQLRRADDHPSVPVASAVSRELSSQTVATAANEQAVDRLLLVAVGDHLDDSERMLLEVSNAGSTVGAQEERAGELVSANRIYRQTAVQRGDERTAALLSDIEPILVELANAGSTLEGKALTDLQQRIESKGLLFKVRVVSAGADRQVRPVAPAALNSL